jgi:type IX secretion system PorP/SprF family membrane protein
MKNIIALLLILGSVGVFSAQSDPNYRRNQFSSLLLNPAQAGANGYDEVSVIASKSMVGFTGAPSTYSALANFKLMDNLGLGISGFNDKLGPINTTRLSVDLAYHIKLTSAWKMSIGLRAMGNATNIDLPSLLTTQELDPHMAYQLSSGNKLDAGWGLLVYHKKAYVGISQPRLMKSKFVNATMTDYVEAKGFVAYAGGDLPLNTKISVRPVVMFRSIKGLPKMLDFASTFTYNSLFDLGFNFQVGSNIGFLAGYELNKKLYFGYSYSYPINGVNRVSSQAHELMLRLKLNDKKSTKFSGPRYFN